MGNGAYLVNGQNANGTLKSAMAWYSDLNRSHDGSQPDAFANVSGVAQGHHVTWEGHQVSGKCDLFSDMFERNDLTLRNRNIS